MNSYFRLFCKSLVCVVIAFILAAGVPACRAESAARLDKHARKIEKRLNKYHEGSYLEFDFRDGSQAFGSLGALSEASFQFTDSDSNKTETHVYGDVAHVKKGKEYIGEGSEPEHHIPHLVPILIGAAAVAAAVVLVETKPF